MCYNAENVLYLELRCSPENYSREELSAEDVVEIICDELTCAAREFKMRFGLLFIASRHSLMSMVYKHS